MVTSEYRFTLKTFLVTSLLVFAIPPPSMVGAKPVYPATADNAELPERLQASATTYFTRFDRSAGTDSLKTSMYEFVCHFIFTRA